MVRFLALFIPDERHGTLRTQVRARLEKSHDGAVLQDFGNWLAVTIGGPIVHLDTGLVVGSLFDRRYPAPVQQLPSPEQRQITASRGQRLTQGYWGNYVALLTDESSKGLHVLRAPFSQLPCYYISCDGATALASDVGMLIDAGLLGPAIQWNAVVRELVRRDLRTAETCLEGVTGLNGGERLQLTPAASGVDRLWSPWDHVGTPSSETEAIEAIRRHAQGCVGAYAAQYENPLLMLSGGLDSSIVAACLAQGQRPFGLVTLVTRDPIGDERRVGRAMAMAAGIRLHERLRDVSYIEPYRSSTASLPRPAGRLFEQESTRLVHEVAKEIGASAIMTGGGGDNVFCALQSAAPVADRLLSEGPGRGVLSTAVDVSRIAQASVPLVLRAALARTLPWRRDSPVRNDYSFLTHTAREMEGGALSHPWLEAPQGAKPGKAAHIKLLAYADGFLQGSDPQTALPTLAPLLGQPLVETCLAVPSWQWLKDGRNRALARQAFARDLPNSIAERRSKGTPDSFLGEIYEAHRMALREMLLGGLLAERGIIDRVALENAFSSSQCMTPPSFTRLLHLVDVESWARSWKTRMGDYRGATATC